MRFPVKIRLSAMVRVYRTSYPACWFNIWALCAVRGARAWRVIPVSDIRSLAIICFQMKSRFKGMREQIKRSNSKNAL